MSISLDMQDNSVLETMRNMLGPSEDYEYFDTDLVPHINSAFNRLKQLGVGPSDGFFITGTDETWSDFFSDSKTINMVISYMYLKVKMQFDPPSSSIASEAYNKQIAEYEWCMNVDAETID